MKKSLAVLFFLFTLFLTSTSNAQVQGGTFFVDKGTKNFTLNDNEGKREVFLEISFSKPFANKPTVLTSLSLLDITGEKYDIQPNQNKTIENNGLKFVVEASGVSRDGFVLKISVWGKTKINAVGGNWFAFEQ